jgi:hypothetical protein
MNRREVLRMAAGVAVVAVLPVAAVRAIPAEGTWEMLFWRAGHWRNPALAAAFRHAKAAGMRADDLAQTTFPNRPETWVLFYGEDEDEMRAFDAHGEIGWYG